jgi:hypothetical protein
VRCPNAFRNRDLRVLSLAWSTSTAARATYLPEAGAVSAAELPAGLSTAVAV